MPHNEIKLIECPRDAMQGWMHFIPTSQKIAYINSLLKIGFDTIDFGSFVSPKAIPQMADTTFVVKNLEPEGGNTKLLAIVANERGAKEASMYDVINYIGFPFSISETFQLRNANCTIEQSLGRVDTIQNICIANNKELVIYLSMGFGNPYGDEYNESILLYWADEMVKRGIGIISLADTVGIASPRQVNFALHTLITGYPGVEFGVHLHSGTANKKEKLESALNAGCKRFDGALNGIGGCPMAQDNLIGNMPMEFMIDYFEERKLIPPLNKAALAESLHLANEIFV